MEGETSATSVHMDQSPFHDEEHKTSTNLPNNESESEKEHSDNDDHSNGDKEGSDQQDEDDENESDLDRKPSARDDDSDDSSSSSSSENEEDQEDGDGHELSEYEKLRLERIRRNREYLSQLGLEENKPKKVPAKSRKRRESLPVHSEPQRASSRSRKSISYAEPSISQLLRDSRLPAPKKEKKPRASGSSKLMHRMERFIYNEFKAIQAYQKRVFKEADRCVRLAEKEVTYWSKRAGVWDRQLERRRVVEEIRQERIEMGGTIREIMQDIDRRMPEILDAVTEYDEEFQAGTRAKERELKRLESEHQMRTLHAIDRFPKAMKSAASLLNAVLLERAPKDPPPPRRSSRAAVAEELPVKSPKKRGRKKKGEDESPTDVTSWPNDIMSSEGQLATSAESPDKDQQDQTSRPRKKIARKVGGWISPNFSDVLDRSWLEQDSPLEAVDPSTYVPQVGDTMLYYPSGHKMFLDEYPDILGKKTRSVTRIPLWERAASEREEMTEENGTVRYNESSWWNDEWLEGVHGDLGKYPIVCRVERTHAEFPPDPYSKSIKKDEDGNIVKIVWKPPKDTSSIKNIDGTPLRLAVTLRPFTPVMPPTWNDDGSGPRDDRKLELPPIFSVVIFPSDNTPFLVPFAWAYQSSHSFSLDEVVMSENEGTVRVRDATPVSETSGSMRLHDKALVLKALVEKYQPTEGRSATPLAEALAKYANAFPSRDAQLVLSTWKSALPSESDSVVDDMEYHSINLVDVVRATLPLWKSITAVPTVLNRKRIEFCPWELRTTAKKSARSGSTLSPKMFSILEVGLIEKVELLINTLLTDEEAAQIFQYPVTDEEAPSYSCAVPLGMSLTKILARLKGSRGSDRCYYRSVDSVLADVSAILDNCLLYNSPDSPVVESAVVVTTKLKESISKTAQLHFRELTEARKVDEERRRQVLRQLAPSSSGGAEEGMEASKQVTISTFKTPFRHKISREWLLQPAQKNSTQWVPQAGDELLYSRKRHESFVKTHFPSLEANQCVVIGSHSSEVQSDDPSSPLSEDWAQATVIWTRAAFPKALSKKSSEDEHTFRTNALLLSVCLQFQESERSDVVYWRPCMLESDVSGHSEGNSCICGLSHSNTFLRAYEDENGSPQTLDVAVNEDIDLALSLLKKRCSRDIAPSFIVEDLTKSNVKSGYVPPTTRGGLRGLPKFDNFLLDDSEEAAKTSSRLSDKKKAKKNDAADPSRDKLCVAGFLPPWLEGTRKHVAEGLDDCQTLVPLPQMSLELVLTRLRNGSYRTSLAVENDVVEAFVTTVVLILRNYVRRKKGPLSMKRVVKMMASNKGAREDTADNPASSQVFDEENEVATYLRSVRELFATALVAVSDTIFVSHLFGLVKPPQAQVATMEANDLEQDPERAAARQKIAYVLAAVGKDQLQNVFSTTLLPGSVPNINVKVTCGGSVVSHKVRVVRTESRPAEWKGRETTVKVRCGGKLFFADKQVSASQEIDPAETKEVVHSSIEFDASDLEYNEQLVKFFFSRPGRSGLCARCTAYGRSLLTCRVRRAHSNMDFDWMATFKGVGGVDGLLRRLHPAGRRQVLLSPEEQVGEDETSAVEVAEDGDGEENEVEEDGDDKEADAEGDDNKDEEGEKNNELIEGTKEPKEILAQAEEVLHKAKVVYGEALEYSKVEARLGEEFIRDYFPVDSSDGHYVYCVVCGISGDLICCDGCSNVLHKQCIGVSEVPEDGDWFCEECEMKRNDKNGPKGSSGTKKLPFGRTDVFDENKINDLMDIIEGMRHCRPHKKKSKKAQEANNDDDSFNAESDDDFDSNGRRSSRRLRRRESSHETSERKKKKRGRSKEPPEARVGKEVKKRRRSRSRKESDFSDPIEALSSETRRFLDWVEISTAKELMAAKTGHLAEDFEKWRIQEGKPPMKGTGTIASVSGWKAMVRKATEKMREEPNVEKPEPSLKKKKRPPPRERTSPSKRRRQSDTERPPRTPKKKPTYSNPLEALSDDGRRFLEWIEISTAEEFVEAVTGHLAQDLVKWRKQEGKPRLKGTGSIATISAWKTLCRNAIAAMEQGDTNTADESESKAEKQRPTCTSEKTRKERADTEPTSEVEDDDNDDFSNSPPPRKPAGRSRQLPEIPRSSGKRRSRQPDRFSDRLK